MSTNVAYSLTIPAQDAAALRNALFTDDGCENFAVMFCASSVHAQRHRLLVREWWSAPPDAYQERLSYHLEISPVFINRIVDHSLKRHLNPVVVHSHPGASQAVYSLSDDYGEGRLLPVMGQLVAGSTPASILMSQHDIRGRVLADQRLVAMDQVKVVGLTSETHVNSPDQPCSGPSVGEEYDRHVRAIGPSGQGAINALRVGIVGLGGTGSAVAEQLARLGVRDFVLVDPDTLESTNVSRMWGTLPRDVNQYKVDVLAQHLCMIAPAVSVHTIRDTVVRQPVLHELRNRDIVFACTDNHWSRAVLNRFAHQYLIPTVDMGVRIDARGGQVSAVGGQVSLIGHGMACLRCSGLIDGERVRAEATAASERDRLIDEGYIQGLGEPEPSVISLNTTVAALSVTAGMAMFTSLLGRPPHSQLRYDATRGLVFPVIDLHDPACDVCSEAAGVKGLGDSQLVSAYE